MARITVEDCLEHNLGRFDLTLLAAKRARKLTMDGVKPMVSWEQDKSTVVALREIAAGLVQGEQDIDKEGEYVLVKPSYQPSVFSMDDLEEDVPEEEPQADDTESP